MSTKIYNAYIYDGNMESLLPHLLDLKLRVWKAAEEHLKIWLETDGLKDLRNHNIRLKMLEASSRKTYDPYNMDSSMVVIPHPDTSKNLSLAVFFGVSYTNPQGKNSTEEDIFGDLASKFKDYHYQNQSDKPEEITDEEWDERKEVWDEVLKESDFFADVGYAYSFIEPDNYYRFLWNCSLD